MVNLVPRACSTRTAIAALLTFSVIGCGDDGPGGGTPLVVSLSLSGRTSFRAVGESSELVVTAMRSNGTSETVAGSAVTWESSEPTIASVAGGTVTAEGDGVATVRATYQMRSAEALISVDLSVHAEGSVRAIYAVPSDRPVRDDYRAAIEDALLDLQSWYGDQLDGPTFSLYDVSPQICELSEPSAFFGRDTWSKVEMGVQRCAPVMARTSSFVWVVYADVVHECNAPGRIGAGLEGLSILGRQDMEGLIGAPVVIADCGEEFRLPVNRYIGGLGHELGHAFGLPHPPGCDAGSSSCDSSALMWLGFTRYPATYLREDEKSTLLMSPFISSRP